MLIIIILSLFKGYGVKHTYGPQINKIYILATLLSSLPRVREVMRLIHWNVGLV